MSKKKPQPEQQEVIHGFKGYDKDLKCRDHQYETGKDYELDGDIKACERGFHFCEHPLDVFSYYPPSGNRFTTVQGSGKISKHDYDTKVACSKIHIGAEITLESLTKAAVKFVFDRAKWSKEPQFYVTGDNEAATASGYQGAATASGNRGAATASGYQGAATASGYQGAATASGNRGAATASGDQGAATASGYQGAATASGYQGAATTSGYQGAATASGYQGAATASGDQGAAVSLGIDAKARGIIGMWLTIAEWKNDSKGNWQRIDIQTIKVDGENTKENTWYRLVDGKFQEA